MQRVAVVGAGPSGIVMVKELVEQGLDVTCFEAADGLGGVFADAYNGCLLTSSTLLTRFSDFDDPASVEPQVWSADGYLSYLARYVDHFDLSSHFTFGTRVQDVLASPDGVGYQLVTETSDGVTERHSFDRVAVCSGTHQKPNEPTFDGADRFEGEILHSAAYRSAETFRGKRVLVIGAGESGSDIVKAVAEVAEATAISVRGTSGFLTPRYFLGNPTDIDTARSQYSLPYWWGSFYHSSRLVGLFPLSVAYRLSRSAEKRAEVPVLRRWARFQLGRNRNAFTTFGSKNLGAIEAMVHHHTAAKPGIERLDERGAVFVDGSRFDCDTIICATGFRNHFPFLQQQFGHLMDDLTTSRRLYKHCVHPELGDSLFLCGFARPGFGALPPMSEMQARWFALLAGGSLELPSKHEMHRVIAEDVAAAHARFGKDAERITTLVDFLAYLDDLAGLIGCRPPLEDLRRDDESLWRKVVLGPISVAQYRLVGPSAKPEVAEKILAELPVSRGPFDLAVLRIFTMLGRIPGLGRFEPAATGL